MKKTLRAVIISLAAAALISCLPIAVFAEEAEIPEETSITAPEQTEDAEQSEESALSLDGHVFDGADALLAPQETDLNNSLETLKSDVGVDVKVLTVTDTEGMSMKEYGEKYFGELEVSGTGMLLLFNKTDRSYGVTVGDELTDIFTEDGVSNILPYLVQELNNGESYYKSFERFATICRVYVEQSELGEPYKNELRVVDRAGLIPDEKEQELLKKCDEISERQSVEVTIVTVNSIGGRTSREYADDYYDYSGFGIDDTRSGILLLISMENRDWAISTTGLGISYFTDKGQEYMVSEFKGYLSDGDYYKAFDMYADLCDMFITEAKDDRPYDVDHMPEHSLVPFREVAFEKLITILPASLILAFIIWLIICTIEKHKLTSVHFKGQADDYIRKGSFVINQRNDTFLYKHTTKRYNPPSESSGGGGGGSSSHSSSSGSSHGGSSGHF